MKLSLTCIILLLSLSFSGCFTNEQDLHLCEEFYVVVEEMPYPIGGIAAIQDQVIYPEEARENGIEGRVTVQFIVDKLGKPRKLSVIRGFGSGADEEAKRVIKKASFQPGKQDGEPKCVQFALSINFRLTN